MGLMKKIFKDEKLIFMGILVFLMVVYLLFTHQNPQPTAPPKMPSTSMTPIIHGPPPTQVIPVGTTTPGIAPVVMGATVGVSSEGQPISPTPAGYILGTPTAPPAPPPAAP